MITNTSAGQYYSLFGSKKRREQDLQEERQRWLGELSQRYPINSKTSCDTLRSYLSGIQAEIDKVTNDRALGVTDAVGARWIGVAGDYKVQIFNAYEGRQCEKIETEQDKQEALDANLALLDKAGNVAQKTSKAPTYIIWGLLGVVVVVSGVIIIKKLKK